MACDLCAVEEAVVVGLGHEVEGLRSESLEVTCAGDTCVGDEHVECAEVDDGRADELGATVEVGNVCLHEYCLVGLGNLIE